MFELRREIVSAEFLDPRDEFQRARAQVEVRWDPLTGHTSRIVGSRGLMPAIDFNLQTLAEETAAGCPFCGDRLRARTPMLVPEIAAEGRIACGQAVLFPNLFAYGQHSSVSVYSPDLHFLPLERMTSGLVGDNLGTQVEFARAVMAADPSASWASINANHMPPSGSSLFHPHLQGAVESMPTTQQRLLADVPPERFEAYLEAERRAGERYLGSTGQVEWLASFAPLAPGELRAFVAAVRCPSQLDGDLVQELGHGIATALNLYAEMGFQSFSMALYGTQDDGRSHVLNLRIACRSNPRPMYRSDATYFERLHWEAAIDLPPEDLAAAAGERFSR